MNDQVLISFKDVMVRGVNEPLFDALNFAVNKGEHWALTGQSGSGKSALLELIAGRLNISKGAFKHPLLDIQLKELQVEQPLLTWQHLIAYVTSKHHFRNLSHTTNFYYQQRFNSTDSEDAETVAAYLKARSPAANQGWTYERVVTRLNLEHLTDKHLIKLSNGETRRLLIASALLKNPFLLIMDNPLTGLDVETRQDFNQLMREIAASGIHIIIATSPAEIPDIITHIAVLNKGKITIAMPRTEFDHSKLEFSAIDQVDLGELKALLSITPQVTFNTIVNMEDVVIRYGEKTILDHVNWHINQAERWALLGPNGAGKSTLLSLINADNPQAYANKITLFDKKRGSGESIWEIKQKIGFVSPELFQYFPTDNSCLQVIESGFYDTLGLFRSSDPAKAAIAIRWMRLLGIVDISAKLFKNVSASTQRLCLLARALIKNPSLLIFDEPLQGLDAHQQAHFKHIVDAICDNSQTTLIYVTHYPEEIPGCVNHTLKLINGKGTLSLESGCPQSN